MGFKDWFSGAGDKSWLSQEGDTFLLTLLLSGVDDPLDADPIWEHQFAGGRRIAEKSTGIRERRLYEALDQHRHVYHRFDQDMQQAVEDERVFTDVVVWIAASVWENNADAGGQRLAIMADRFRARHEQYFPGDVRLQKNAQGNMEPRRPRYCIMPAADLERDEVRCQFGLSVFVPDADDVKVADLNLHFQGEAYPFSPWIFYEPDAEGEIKRIERVVGCYVGQLFFRVAADVNQAVLHPPVWFSERRGWLGANLLEQPAQSFSDKDYIKADRIETGFGGLTRCIYGSLQGRSQTLCLEIQPDAQTSQNASDTTQDVLFGKTITLDNSISEVGEKSYRLVISALALPRLDGRLSQQYSGWCLAFDALGNLVSPQDQRASLWLSNHKHRAGIWQREGQNSAENRVNLPDHVRCGGQALQILPAPMETDYMAILPLAQPRDFALKDDKTAYIIGRKPQVSPQRQESDIALYLVDEMGTLLDVEGRAHQYSLNYLGLSANHLEVRRRDEVLDVRQLSRSAATWLLDAQGKVKDVLPAGSKKQVQLAVGESLLLGAYVLHFYHPEMPNVQETLFLG